MKLYDYLDSGNGYKVRLLLAQLGIAYQWQEIDIDRGEGRTPAYLARHLMGGIPRLELDDGTLLSESNAMLWYLAEGSPYVPEGRFARAQTLQWMFFEQYQHEPAVATPRYILRHLPADSPRRAEMPARLERGRAAIATMDKHLATNPFFVAGRYSIADIALYAYTHVAHEAQLDLAPYSNVRAWLGRIAQQPRHVPLTRRPT
jgi:glutathione S-transferase